MTFDEDFQKIKEDLSLVNDCIKIMLSNINAVKSDDKSGCWNIEYIRPEINYYLIHELGHIILAKEASYSYFAREPNENTNQDVFDYINYLIDCFANYHSFNSEYYPLYLNYIDKLLNLIHRGFVFTNTHELLGGYLGFYLEFKYNLKVNDKENRQVDIKTYLRNLKNIIVQNSQLYHQLFQKINRKLDDFEFLRSTDNPEEIIKFCFDLLEILPFWNKEFLKYQFTLIFQNIDLSFLE